MIRETRSLPGSSASPNPFAGRLSLRFERDDRTGETRLAACEQRPPLKVVRAFPVRNGEALVHLHNLSGGVLGGDHLELDVEVGRGASAQITSTGATRLYRSRQEAATAVQRTRVRVGPDALLEFLPDPLIPFAGSRYRQETTIELADDAGLFWWETIAPGREASAELFAYDLLQIRLDLTAAGARVAEERMRLEPSRRPLDSPARLGQYRYFSTFYVCKVGLEAARWTELERELGELARRLSRPFEIYWGVSMLPAHGIVVRGLSVKGAAVTSGLPEFWRAAKARLYWREAVAPRKVY